MKLLICEKKLQAEKFAQVFSKYSGKPYKLTGGYYSNGTDLNIGFAQGHIVQLVEAESYDEKYKQWKKEDLPIIPNPFKLEVNKDKVNMYKNLKEIACQADVIYNATDPAREGELIFRYIIDKIGKNALKNNVTFKRLWCNAYEYKTVIDAYENAKPLSDYDNLYDCAKARSHSDWLIGINSTRMLTVSTKSKNPLSLGRVQTAVLRIIVDRFLENQNFVSQKTFTPVITLSDSNLTLKLNKYFLDEQEAKKLLDSLSSKVHLNKDVTKGKEKQPELFSLVKLQILLSKKFGFSADSTLSYAQKLYEEGLISYPRTDSSYLTNDQKGTISTLINTIKGNNIYNLSGKDFLSEEQIQKHFIFNDSKTSDHYAMIPTCGDIAKAQKLGKEEGLVFEEILKRFIRCFMQEAEIQRTKYSVKLEEKLAFTTSGKIILKAGHLKLQGKEEVNQDSEEQNTLPDLQEGDYSINQKQIREGKTTPPPLFTESSLLEAMEKPQKFINLEETSNEKVNKEILREIHLGTPATIHMFIPILTLRKYINIEKKNVIPTKLGIAVIEQLKNTKIAQVALTLNIEEKLEDIAQGKITYDRFMRAITSYVNDILKQIEQTSNKISENIEQPTPKKYLKCPKCKNGNLYLAKTKVNYYCSNIGKEGDEHCDFSLFLNQYNKKLSEKNIKDLVEKGRTSDIIKGMKSQNGKEMEGYLLFTEDFKKVVIEFAKSNSNTKSTTNTKKQINIKKELDKIINNK